MSKSPDPERLNVSDQAAYFKHGSIRKFSDIEIFQHSGKGIPQFMTGIKIACKSITTMGGVFQCSQN